MRSRVAFLLVGAVALLASCTEQSVEPVADTGCYLGSSDTLAAQTVASASFVPCVSDLDEFDLSSSTYKSDGSKFTFVGSHFDGSWTVELVAQCDVDGAEPQVAGTATRPGTYLLTEPGSRYRTTTYYVFDGGCVTSSLDLPASAAKPPVIAAIGDALHLVPRAAISDHVNDLTDGELSLDPD